MFAAIDIGTNSTLLLIGDFSPDGKLRPTLEETRITRLGEGLSKGGALLPEAANRTMSALKEYRQLCQKHNVSSVAAVGSAGLRDASNAKDFILTVKNELGLEIEVISPEREAWLTFYASAKHFGSDILVCDIGGGSTELVWGKMKTPGINREECQFLSMPIGSVNLTEKIVKSDPASSEEFKELCSVADQHLNYSLNTLSHRHAEIIVATAGTATTLAAMEKRISSFDSKKIHGITLNMLDIQVIIDLLKTKPVTERRKMIGLQRGREDIILAGAVILDRVMRRLGYDVVTISDRGLRWGLFYEKFGPH